MAAVVDVHGPQDRAAPGAAMAIPLRKHPLKQLMGMGQVR
jgi:hypothetical protein